MALKLPQVEIRQPGGLNEPLKTPEHIRRDFARRDVELMRADFENCKMHQDVQIFPPQEFILHSPNGSEWPVIVNDGGQITAKGGPQWLAETQYAERTSDYTATTTSTPILSASAIDVPTGYSIDVYMEAYLPSVEIGTNASFLARVRINGTDSGIIANMDPKGGELYIPIFAARRVTFPAGNYLLELSVMKTGSAAVTVRAGPGGAGNYFPAFLRISATIHP